MLFYQASLAQQLIQKNDSADLIKQLAIDLLHCYSHHQPKSQAQPRSLAAACIYLAIVLIDRKHKKKQIDVAKDFHSSPAAIRRVVRIIRKYIGTK